MKKDYYKDPKRCKKCNKVIEYNKRNNIFCSRSCAASFNNRGINRWKTEKRYCKNCNSEIKGWNKKFCSMQCHRDYEKKEYLKRWLEEGVLPIMAGGKPNQTIRGYIKEQQDNNCAICGIGDEWNGKELIFVLDHIDGNSSNNGRDNLRLICSNCDSQLPTYKSKNKGNGRHYRTKRYEEGKSY